MKLKELESDLQSARELAGENTAVCMTGSYGRMEAGEHSDLDVFLVSLDDLEGEERPNDHSRFTRIYKSQLSALDETCIRADLIRALRKAKLPKLDADGKYAVQYSVSTLVGMLGRPDDDSSNAFTARLLLLLEGRPLFGQEVFANAVDAIINSYWRDFDGREGSFAPAFMSNDILRLWRTFCVNYEARTAITPEKKKISRRLKNYKLKYSRLLTCYSALIFLLSIYSRNKTVTPIDMKQICAHTPIERIEVLRAESPSGHAKAAFDSILRGYEKFLVITHAEEKELLRRVADNSQLSAMLEDSYEFANSIFNAVNLVGGNSKLHRMMVV